MRWHYRLGVRGPDSWKAGTTPFVVQHFLASNQRLLINTIVAALWICFNYAYGHPKVNRSKWFMRNCTRLVNPI